MMITVVVLPLSRYFVPEEMESESIEEHSRRLWHFYRHQLLRRCSVSKALHEVILVDSNGKLAAGCFRIHVSRLISVCSSHSLDQDPKVFDN